MEKVKIKYHSLEFSETKSTFYDYNDLSFSWNQILWAAITIGRESWTDVKEDKDNYVKEIIFRKSMMDFAISVLPKTEKEELKFRPFTSLGYNNMDSSEKTAISYFMGTVFSKLFSSRLLKCPWLMHLDRYQGKRFKTTFIKNGKDFHSTQRPDLVGLRSKSDILDDLDNPYITSKWIAFESKGRSKRSKKTLDDAKEQLKNLDKIEGDDPLRIAFQTYVSDSKEIKVVWRDPEGENVKNSYCLSINKREFLYEYYSPIYRLVVSNDKLERVILNDKIFFTYEIDNTLKIGLESTIFLSMFFHDDIKEIYEQQNENYIAFYEYQDAEYNWSEGSDGVIIGTRLETDPFINSINFAQNPL